MAHYIAVKLVESELLRIAPHIYKLGDVATRIDICPPAAKAQEIIRQELKEEVHPIKIELNLDTQPVTWMANITGSVVHVDSATQTTIDDWGEADQKGESQVGSELLVLDTTDTSDKVLAMGDNVYPSPPVPRRELKTGYPPYERINQYENHNMYGHVKYKTMMVTPLQQNIGRNNYDGRSLELKCAAFKEALGIADTVQLNTSSSDSECDSDDSIVTMIANPRVSPWMNSINLRRPEQLPKTKVNPITTVARVPGLVRTTTNEQLLVPATSSITDLAIWVDSTSKGPAECFPTMNKVHFISPDHDVDISGTPPLYQPFKTLPIKDRVSVRPVADMLYLIPWPKVSAKTGKHYLPRVVVTNPPSGNEAKQYQRRVNVIQPYPETKILKWRKTTVPTFINPFMNNTERCWWTNWGMGRDHPMEHKHCDYNRKETFQDLPEWPMIIRRPNGFMLHHACRVASFLMLDELVPLNIYNFKLEKVTMIWVPPACGPDSAFHISIQANHVKTSLLANQFGFPSHFNMSQNTEKFFMGIALGTAKYHELYVGQCHNCELWVTHSDGYRHLCKGHIQLLPPQIYES